MRLKLAAAACAAALVIAPMGSAMADGDVDAGAKVFKKCGACHGFDPEKKKIGPHLNGVVDRPAAAIDGFKYSSAMMESGLAWNTETLDLYLTKPKKLVPGTKMVYAGLKKPEDRINVIAYIVSMSTVTDEGAAE